MSRNLVELVRRHHAVQAPTALEVLEGGDRRARRDHRRRPARRGGGVGPARGDRLRRLDLLRRPAPAARRAPRPRVHRHRVLRGHRRRARRRAAATGSGLELGERSEDGAVSLAETVCLGFCHSSPAVRDGDTIDAGPDVIERVLARRDRDAPRARVVERARRAGADAAGRLVGAATRAGGARARAAARARSRRPTSAAAAARASRPAPSGSSRATRRARRSSSSPTATRATRAPTSTST